MIIPQSVNWSHLTNTRASVNTTAAYQWLLHSLQQLNRINFMARYYSGQVAHLGVTYGAPSDSSTTRYWPLITGIHVWLSVQGQQEGLGWGSQKRRRRSINDRMGAENRVINNTRWGSQSRRTALVNPFTFSRQPFLFKTGCSGGGFVNITNGHTVVVGDIYVIESMHRGQYYSAELPQK